MPLSIRGRGSAFATGIGNWLVGTVWSQVSPIGLGEITYKFYFIFVAFNLCVTLPTIWFVFKVSQSPEFGCCLGANSRQETNQLTLEEIDLLFGDRALGMLPDNLGDAEKQIEMERIEDARKKLAGKNVTAVH